MLLLWCRPPACIAVHRTALFPPPTQPVQAGRPHHNRLPMRPRGPRAVSRRAARRGVRGGNLSCGSCGVGLPGLHSGPSDRSLPPPTQPPVQAGRPAPQSTADAAAGDRGSSAEPPERGGCGSESLLWCRPPACVGVRRTALPRPTQPVQAGRPHHNQLPMRPRGPAGQDSAEPPERGVPGANLFLWCRPPACIAVHRTALPLDPAHAPGGTPAPQSAADADAGTAGGLSGATRERGAGRESLLWCRPPACIAVHRTALPPPTQPRAGGPPAPQYNCRCGRGDRGRSQRSHRREGCGEGISLVV